MWNWKWSKNVHFDEKNERKTWEIELLIYRIYCCETKNKSFREMKRKKSQQSKEGVYQHQIRELKQWNCSAQTAHKKESKAWKHFRNSSREATEIQLLTNLAFKIAEFLPELPILCFTARSSKYLAIQICCCWWRKNNSTFWKIDFTPNYYAS